MDVQLHVLPLAEPRELVTATKHREGQSEGPLRRPPQTHHGAAGPLGVVWRRVGPPSGDTDLRPDLGVTSPESLLWGPTPLELLTNKGALTHPKAGRPSFPVGRDTPRGCAPASPLDEFLEDAPTQVLADLLNVGLGDTGVSAACPVPRVPLGPIVTWGILPRPPFLTSLLPPPAPGSPVSPRTPSLGTCITASPCGPHCYP